MSDGNDKETVPTKRIVNGEEMVIYKNRIKK